jgi:predicted nucleic acid-binding protein
MKLYLDTCIWLNLLKKERGVWEAVIELLCMSSQVYVSTIVLKELSYVLGKDFLFVRNQLRVYPAVIFCKTTREDYSRARDFELQHGAISFYDYLHIAIAKRLGCPLITRDKDLRIFGKSVTTTLHPNDLLK